MMSTCNRSDLESLVSPLVMPKISTDTVVAVILKVGMLELGTLTKRFGVTYYLELHILLSTINVIVYHVKMLLFYNVQKRI
jgi:hypothetical protein